MKPEKPIPYQLLSEMLVDGKLRFHHSALFRGYVSRTRKDEDVVAYPYSGRFGTGYVAYFPNWSSTNYSYIAYYVFVD